MKDNITEKSEMKMAEIANSEFRVYIPFLTIPYQVIQLRFPTRKELSQKQRLMVGSRLSGPPFVVGR